MLFNFFKYLKKFLRYCHFRLCKFAFSPVLLGTAEFLQEKA